MTGGIEIPVPEANPPVTRLPTNTWSMVYGDPLFPVVAFEPHTTSQRAFTPICQWKSSEQEIGGKVFVCACY